MNNFARSARQPAASRNEPQALLPVRCRSNDELLARPGALNLRRASVAIVLRHVRIRRNAASRAHRRRLAPCRHRACARMMPSAGRLALICDLSSAMRFSTRSRCARSSAAFAARAHASGLSMPDGSLKQWRSVNGKEHRLGRALTAFAASHRARANDLLRACFLHGDEGLSAATGLRCSRTFCRCAGSASAMNGIGVGESSYCNRNGCIPASTPRPAS